MQLTDKRALITGGAVRVGAAISRELAAAGCKLAIHFAHSRSAAKGLVETLRAQGCEAVSLHADLSDSTQPRQLVGAAVEQLGGLDLLVNNAALFPSDDSFSRFDIQSWNQIMGLNLRAPALLAQAFSTVCGTDAAIVNIIDARVTEVGVDHFVYRLSKLGLAELTRMLALELAPGVRVNGVAPGAILAPADTSEASLRELKQGRIPLERLGDPTQIADMVRMLLAQPFVTGQVLSVDGGEFL